ncbi:AbiH family protein [Flavobacterium cellulosilyticum]|uniref:Bacteriophage abortive infection AbiH n=1 Tax=Flavobacterium cellulosilyticum TaxID=2541731 RepID=A0A4R5CI05_9FLAO|nr:AbiH family protein [Flavobacterium cellulosilyticum]TDD99848.1 hypothetical protein E0F76_03765 [Flavobacterium cellulosilyticum]
MNRLVIIGNGFDLAHGLPTSYKDFIDDYWKKVNSSSYDDDFVSFENIGQNLKFYHVENLKGLANFIMQYDEKIKFSDAEIYREHGNNNSGKYPRAHILNYKNVFFRLINQKSIQNWVDIENEYYRELKKIMKSKCLDISKSEDYWSQEQKAQVEKLNIEFEDIKNLLENYLSKTFDAVYNFENIMNLDIINHLNSNPRYEDFLFEKEDGIFYNKKENLKLGNTLLLSFNYTKTALDYSNYLSNKGLDINYNYIHGKTGVKELPIIFGFGDEMDDDYKELENIDENEYLKYFKSIQYLEHSNYKYLYNFVEKEPFQVFVFGHSCGLSDRTLLSTIFENRNCFSLRVFYHQKKSSDNYTELIQNISRHFADKKMLRKKVVEKRHCEALIKFIAEENGSLS